ncbi:MAG: SRPBCC family protein [Kofleriaceae bacterium]
MHSVTVFVPQDPKVCWRMFTDAQALLAWVPGLRSAQVLAKLHGLPSEIHFEFAGSLVYTLSYTYDLDKREVHWQPKLGKRDGVTGFVRFDPKDAGTEVTYALAHGDNRDSTERALGDLQTLADAFAAWVCERGRA